MFVIFGVVLLIGVEVCAVVGAGVLFVGFGVGVFVGVGTGVTVLFV